MERRMGGATGQIAEVYNSAGIGDPQGVGNYAKTFSTVV
jgi:hypothetical protein